MTWPLGCLSDLTSYHSFPQLMAIVTVAHFLFLEMPTLFLFLVFALASPSAWSALLLESSGVNSLLSQLSSV